MPCRWGLLRGSLREPVGEALLGRGSPLGDWFVRSRVEALWHAHQSGKADHRKPLWTLFCLAAAIGNTAAKNPGGAA